jgi:hypothetical protein
MLKIMDNIHHSTGVINPALPQIFRESTSLICVMYIMKMDT